MKLNSLIAKPLRLRGVQLVALGSIAFASQVACSDAAGPPAAPPFNGTSGSSSTAGTGGTTSTAGTSATAGTGTGGTFGTAGTGTAGTGTAGTFGSSGATTGGTGGSTAGTDAGGTGGTFEPPKPFCDTQAAVTLPYTVNKTYQLSQWSPLAVTQVKANNDIMPAVTGCAMRPAGAVGDCSSWKYSSVYAEGAAPAPLWVQWVTQWDPNHKADPICMPATAKAVTFSAKGAAGGEKILVSAGDGQQAKEITLTTEWATYFVSVDGIAFNSFTEGVIEGFAWSLNPIAETPTMVFYLDNLQWVAEAPAP